MSDQQLSTLRSATWRTHWYEFICQTGVLLLSFATFSAWAPGASAEIIEFVSMFPQLGVHEVRFARPTAVAVDNTGQIFVAERTNHRFQICDYQGLCSEYGSFGTGPGQFTDPQGIAVDSQGQVLIAEGEQGDRIQILDQQGNWIAFIGSSGADVGQFSTPAGLVVDQANRIIVSELGNRRVQICSYEGACTAFGGSGTALGTFNFPRGVAIDHKGRIVVADWGNHRIQVCDYKGSCFAFGSFGDEAGQFNSPAGVAVDSLGRIIVADRNNNRLQVCSENGDCQTFGGPGLGPGEFNGPVGIAVDDNDRIIVGERDNNRIQILQITDTNGDDFQISAGLNGNWWNGPERNGEGVQIEVADGGAGSQVFVATVYSYDTLGNQIFLVAVGFVSGDTAEVEVFITEGGLWGDDFDPALVKETPWGTGAFTASSCAAVHMALTPNAEFQAKGYSDLMYDLVRLTASALPCPIDDQE